MTRRRLLFTLGGILGCLALGYSQSVATFPSLLGRTEGSLAPFQSGERLTYQIYWKPLFLIPALKAGEIRIEIREFPNSDPKTWKIRAWADSDGALTRIAGIEIRNYFESEIDRVDYRSYRNLQQTREGKRHRDLELRFDYRGNRTLVRETDPAATPPRLIRDQVKNGIPSPVVDILSIFYVTRLKQYAAGERFHFHLNHRGDFEEVRVMAVRTERLRTPLGRFPSTLLSTQGGLFREGGDFRLWIAQDGTRVPLRFEADVKFGKVYGDLIRLESPQLQRSVIRVQ